MQANCPNCSQRIVIDDAKVPDRAFSVKCPKCQTVVKFPGKGAAPPTIAVAAAPATATFAVPPASGAFPALTPTAGPAEAPATESGPSEAMRAQMMAQLRRELAIGEGRPAGRAMVALPDRARAGAMALPLTRLGYQVDTVDNPEEGARLLEQGVYDLVVTTRAPAAGGRESLYQRISRLSADGRRRIFLVLVGDEFKTGDGQQAFVAQADLLIHPKDAANIESVLLNTISERSRLYQVFLETRRRYEESVV